MATWWPNYEKIGERAELAVILGGDGTMLNAARQLARVDVPLVGINQGRLGFMTDIALDDMIESVTALFEGKFSREQPLSARQPRFCAKAKPAYQTLALNDVVVNKGDHGAHDRTRNQGRCRIDPCPARGWPDRFDSHWFDRLCAVRQWSDPASRRWQGIAIVPLCPHALSNRPITVSDSSTIDITLAASARRASALRWADEYFDARAGDVVRMARSRHNITLLHPPGYSYFAMLRQKLHWSSTPRH
jgi:NAD+ kinase